MSYEYKVVPAPLRGIKARGAKTPQDRFAHALQAIMNDLAAERWEYLRADTLPCEQREGLMSKTTVYQNMLVFRRAKDAAPVTTRHNEPLIRATPPKSGDDRLAGKAALAQPRPVSPPRPPNTEASDAEAAKTPRPPSDIAAQ